MLDQVFIMVFRRFLSAYCKCSALEFGFILILIWTEVGCSSSTSKHSKNEGKMENSKFDFNFKWDDEPPEFISQFDLDVTWDGEEMPSRVTIHNVTMNQDYDITAPMTKLITSAANKSMHERQNTVTVLPSEISQEPKKDIGFSKQSTIMAESSSRSCTCDDIDSLLKNVQVLKGKRGKRGTKGTKGEPGLSIVGPKGEPGHPGLLPYHLLHPENLKGERGETGPRGPPGQCSTSCQNSASASATGPSNLRSGTSRSQELSNKPNYRIVPGALVFKSFPTMAQMSAYVMIGSVAFVEDTDEFYGKVEKGWRKFLMEPFH